MKILISTLITGVICLTLNMLTAQNAPISTIGTVATYNDSATVSVTVTDFTNIGACDLKIIYDSTVAKATIVELGPGVGQFFFLTDVDTIGKIYVSWLFFQYGIPGLTLPDNSVFLNITFERINYGYAAIEFDNSSPDNCLFTDENYDILNDLPYSTYYIDGSISFMMIDAPITSAPVIESCPGLSIVDIPVSVSGFNQVGAFTLTMQYSASVFTFQSFSNVSGFPNLEVIENSPGTIVAEGISNEPEGVTLADNSTLFTIYLGNLGGLTALTWLDLGESCAYYGPAPFYELRNDDPQSSFYINGSFTELPLPSQAGMITGPLGGIVCQGDSNVVFSIAPIPFATGYDWELPEGAIIDMGEGTPEISVSFNDSALSGNVSVFGTNNCGNGLASPFFPVVVNIAPSIIVQPVSPDTINAGDGTVTFSVTAVGADLSYQWQEFTTSWSDITDGEWYSGTSTSLLTITNPPITMNGNKYRCIVSGSCEPPAISDGNATLSVVIPSGFDEWNTAEYYGNESLKFNSFPNPFSDKITFAYVTPSKGTVNIAIVDMYGVIVSDITDQIETQGYHKLFFNANHLIPGVYIASITFKNDTMIIRGQLITISKK
jgi:hypothetical protein